MKEIDKHLHSYVETGDENSLLKVVNRIDKVVRKYIRDMKLTEDDVLIEDIVNECVCYFMENVKSKSMKFGFTNWYSTLKAKVFVYYLEYKYQINMNHSTVKKVYSELVKTKILTNKKIDDVRKTTNVSENLLTVIHNIVHNNNIDLNAEYYDPYESDEDYYDGNDIGNTYYEPFNVICRNDIDSVLRNAIKYFKSKKKRLLSLYSVIVGEYSDEKKKSLTGVSLARIHQIVQRELFKYRKEKMLDKLNYTW